MKILLDESCPIKLKKNGALEGEALSPFTLGRKIRKRIFLPSQLVYRRLL
jgi:hypothetical protein